MLSARELKGGRRIPYSFSDPRVRDLALPKRSYSFQFFSAEVTVRPW